MKKFLLYFLLFGIFTSYMNLSNAEANKISKTSTTVKSHSNFVKISDSMRGKEQLITNEKQLNQFHYYWAQKQPVKQHTPSHWRYQITLGSPSKKSHWVYDPAGYTREVSMDKSDVIYRLTPIRSFNRFLTKE